MKIISMMTKDYRHWAPTWIDSVRRHMPHARIVIYTINYNDKIHGIRTARFNCKTINKFNGRDKITYLKGCLIHSAMLDDDCVVWLDITAILRGDVGQRLFNPSADCHLVTRKHLSLYKNSPKLHYCAELQVWRNRSAVARYAELCEKDKDNWFADQVSLSTIEGEFKVDLLRHPEFCNLSYDESAISWSARSDKEPPGNGIANEKDEQYALGRFRHDLYKGKPRILAYIYSRKWCFESTALPIINALSHKYCFVPCYQDNVSDVINEGHYDMVWSRGSARGVGPTIKATPKYKNKVAVTLTTGGVNTPAAIAEIRRHLSPMVVVTQNSQATHALSKIDGKPRIFQIPNGVDIWRFKPTTFPDGMNIVGFAGRHVDIASDARKGYSEFVVEGAKAAGMKLETCGYLKHEHIGHGSMETFYNNVNYILQPSDAEGCSNTIMEAMSCGRVCLIVQGVGYHGEVCDGDIKSNHAEVVFVNRDKKDIATKLGYLKSHPEVYKRISSNARYFAEQHTLDYAIQKYDEMFDWCTQRR